MKCEICKGTGKTAVFKNGGADLRKHSLSSDVCPNCFGAGVIDMELLNRKEAGKCVKRRMTMRGHSIADVARLLKLEPCVVTSITSGRAEMDQIDAFLTAYDFISGMEAKQ